MNEVKTVKVVMVGESGAGKSALLSRFLENNFEDVMPSTIGIDFKHKVVELHDGSKVRLQLWDTAGQERFRQLAPSYVRDAGVIILTFDKSSEEAIEQLIRWKRLIERDRRPNSLIVIVGNKCDLSTSSRRASTATLKKLIKEAGDLYMETSAKTGKNVQELFKKVARLPFPEAKKVMILSDWGNLLEKSIENSCAVKVLFDKVHSLRKISFKKKTQILA